MLNNQRKAKNNLFVIGYTLVQQWDGNLTQSHECDINQRFTGPELNVQRDTVAEHPQNDGFILSNSSTHVNRRDGFSYNPTVGTEVHFSHTLK